MNSDDDVSQKTTTTYGMTDTAEFVFPIWDSAPDHWLTEDHDRFVIRDVQIVGDYGSEELAIELERLSETA